MHFGNTVRKLKSGNNCSVPWYIYCTEARNLECSLKEIEAVRLSAAKQECMGEDNEKTFHMSRGCGFI